jgi:nitrile hydratase accessory protein
MSDVPLIEPGAARQAARTIPSIPQDAQGPVFREPWEARAFAMAVALHAAGLFAWTEWAEQLGAELKRAQAAGNSDTGENYYHHWLATLERIVAEKGATTREALAQHYRAWEHAAYRTPHGVPIELMPEDL